MHCKAVYFVPVNVMTSATLKKLHDSAAGQYVAGLLFLFLFCYDIMKLWGGGLTLEVKGTDGELIPGGGDTKYPRKFISHNFNLLSGIVGLSGDSPGTHPLDDHALRMTPGYHRSQLSAIRRDMPQGSAMLDIVEEHIHRELTALGNAWPTTSLGAAHSTQSRQYIFSSLGRVNPRKLAERQDAKITGGLYRYLEHFIKVDVISKLLLVKHRKKTHP